MRFSASIAVVRYRFMLPTHLLASHRHRPGRWLPQTVRCLVLPVAGRSTMKGHHRCGCNRTSPDWGRGPGGPHISDALRTSGPMRTERITRERRPSGVKGDELLGNREPPDRVELSTTRLRIESSTTELRWQCRGQPLKNFRMNADGQCPGPDSNRDDFRHCPLKTACLPIPPPGQARANAREEASYRGPQHRTRLRPLARPKLSPAGSRASHEHPARLPLQTSASLHARR